VSASAGNSFIAALKLDYACPSLTPYVQWAGGYTLQQQWEGPSLISMDYFSVRTFALAGSMIILRCEVGE